MNIFLQQLINGLTTGTLFALIAIGYTMVYGIIELINFAHGDLFMLGSFLALTLVMGSGMTVWVVLLISLPLFFVGFNAPPAFLKGRLPNPSWLAGGITGLGSMMLFALVLKYQTLGAHAGAVRVVLVVALVFLICMTFCASLNFMVDRLVYKPLRNAPKLTPLVSA